jgi:FlaA1/EpsC-like NDP-sugar epimerase
MYISNRLYNKNFLLLLFSDIMIVIISFYLSVLFRFDFTIPKYIFQNLSFEIFLLVAFIKIFCFRIFALYRGMWRYTSVWDALNILKGNLLASLILFLLIFSLNKFQNFSRSVFIIDFILCSGVIGISRVGIRIFFSHIYNIIRPDLDTKLSKNILLIGAGYTGQALLRQVLEMPGKTIRVIGFLDDNPRKIRSRLHDVEVLGKVKDLNKIKIIYDEIYICIPSATKNQMYNIINECKKTKKPFKTLPSISELVSGKVSISHLRDVSIVDLLGREEISLDKTAINKFIRGKRVVVTGAGGSIGSELARQCIKFEPSVLIMIDNCELNLFQIENELLAESKVNILFKPILSDIRDFSGIDQIFKEFKPQLVFHAAAYKHVPMQEAFPSEAVKTNILGTKNIATLSIKYHVEKFVLVSTDKAVRPTNVMGATKRIAEILLQNFNREQEITDFMVVRFGNVLGSSGSVIPIFQKQIKHGGPVTVTDPDMKRYFMSIPEASQLILQAGSLGIGGEVFILDMGSPIKIIDIAEELIRLSGFEPDIDIPVIITGSRPGEKKVEELSLPSEKLDNTKHDKIFVLKEPEVLFESLSEINNLIKGLSDNLSKKKPNEIIKILSNMLPDYKPDTANTNTLIIDSSAKA